VLREDHNFTWYLLARGLAFVGTMGSGFYTVYALQHFGAPDWSVGLFTSALLAGQIAGNLGLGALADRSGHMVSLLIGMGALLAANVVALSASSLEVFTLVFLLQGVQLAAVNVSGLNVLLEFAPGPVARPTYVGLGTTLTTPVAFGAPLLAGLMADLLGFPAVFLAGSVGALVSTAVLLGRVQEPRRRPSGGS
jgi:MFS family permease